MNRLEPDNAERGDTTRNLLYFFHTIRGVFKSQLRHQHWQLPGLARPPLTEH